MHCCHWVLIAWLWLGYMHCITKFWVSHARVKSIVVIPKFNLVWPCHVFHNLPCFRFGLFLVETHIHYVMPSMLFFIHNPLILFILFKIFSTHKKGICVRTHHTMICQACRYCVLPIIFGYSGHQNLWLYCTFISLPYIKHYAS